MYAAFYGVLKKEDDIAKAAQHAKELGLTPAAGDAADAGLNAAMAKAQAKAAKKAKRDAARAAGAYTGKDIEPDHDAVIAFLLTLDADVTVSDVGPIAENISLLHHACAFGNVSRAQWLLARNCAVDARTIRGVTPLMECARRGFVSLGIVILQAGANIEATDDSGRTALHYAAEFGGSVFTRLMLTSGANRHARTQDDATPLDLAVAANRKATVQALRVFKPEPIAPRDYLEFYEEKMGQREGLASQVLSAAGHAADALFAGGVSAMQRAGDLAGTNASAQRAIWSEAMANEPGYEAPPAAKPLFPGLGIPGFSRRGRPQTAPA